MTTLKEKEQAIAGCRRHGSMSMVSRMLVSCKSWITDRRAERDVRVAFSNPAQEPVLIYQMGKVGSTTLYHSLKTTEASGRVLHVHFLSDDIEKHIHFCKEAGLSSIPYHFRLGLALRTMLHERPDCRCKVISLVRDPIAVVVSGIFQVPEFVKSSCLNLDGTFNREKVTKHVDESLADIKTFEYVFTWFDREVKEVFGIDVFSKDFDKVNGYSVYSGSRADALVIRLEDLSRTGPDAIAGFLDLHSPLVLCEKNVRSKSTEGSIYQDVINSVTLTKGVCDKIYTSRFARQFYSQKEIDVFTAKWMRASLPEESALQRDTARNLQK
ncbi:MAG: putative capsular polysaccharide synthesis family protein [Kiritimatiellae bacterium]|nr:putative capsular polysaccharide synthesis family protein [Kiritimatiellia bacterium]MDD5522694.1 putative capsular polysaccharide synthesis family protein [Kiritimatiellia bacterium]